VLGTGIFIALTAFTLQSKYDFSSWGPFLYMSLWGLIIAGLIQLFLPYNSVVDFVIALFGALIFCGYIIFDTYMINKRLSPEEYIVASVELYLDMINLFLRLLRILDRMNRR